jgi:plasmid stabilization system protein ParE
LPDVDYVALFVLPGRQLTGSEITAIADELADESDPQSARAIRRAIKTVTDQPRRTPTSPGSGPSRPADG